MHISKTELNQHHRHPDIWKDITHITIQLAIIIEDAVSMHHVHHYYHCLNFTIISIFAIYIIVIVACMICCHPETSTCYQSTQLRGRLTLAIIMIIDNNVFIPNLCD